MDILLETVKKFALNFLLFKTSNREERKAQGTAGMTSSGHGKNPTGKYDVLQKFSSHVPLLWPFQVGHLKC